MESFSSFGEILQKNNNHNIKYFSLHIKVWFDLLKQII